jgi:hypothetical protein
MAPPPALLTLTMLLKRTPSASFALWMVLLSLSLSLVTGVTKQGGSLSSVKSTLTTSLGHHYLNDLMSTDPDTIVITSGHTQKADPHLLNDALQTTIVMAEAMDDSCIFVCSLSLLRQSMEQFQFAYGWLTQWSKSMA